MILTSRFSIGLLCFAAGGLSAGLTGLQDASPTPRDVGGPYTDVIGYRVDCDDFRTTRAADIEYWEKMAATEMGMLDAIEAVLISTREEGKGTVQIHGAKFVPSPRPTFELEVISFDEEEQEASRWLYTVGTVSKSVKKFIQVYQYPGHPPVGDFQATSSGVLYNDFRPGTGDTVQADSQVLAHYVAATLDGKVIWDTYVDRNPQTFFVNQAMTKGLQEGVVGMKVGGKRKVVMPPELGFGALGKPGSIPPDATIVFDLEIRKIL